MGRFCILCVNGSGPPREKSPVNRSYAGFGVSCPVIENDCASRFELSNVIPRFPLYSDRPALRKLPNAADCANGEDAPLFTLPLISRPSADAAAFISCGPLSASAALAPSPAAFTLAR